MITSRIIAEGILRAVGIIFIAAIGCYVLFKIQNVILYLLISLIFTMIGSRIKYFIMKYLKLKNLAAAIVTIIFFMLMIAGFVIMFIPLIFSQIENLSQINTLEIKRGIDLFIHQTNSFLYVHGINSDKLWSQTNYMKINFSFIPNLLNNIISIIADFGIGLASTLFITFIFLKDQSRFTAGVKAILPDKHEAKILSSLRKINGLLGRYFMGIIIQFIIVFTLYLCVLLLFGISNALTIAFLCALLNIIPYIGPLIGGVLAGLLTMIHCLAYKTEAEVIPTTIFVLIGFILVHLIDSNISQPIIFSNITKSHPLEIFLVILIAGFLFGILGLIFAIPIYTILKVAGKEFFPENKIIQLLTHNI